MISRDLPEPANTVFIDSNVPMYLIGAPHLNKETVRPSRTCFTSADSLALAS